MATDERREWLVPGQPVVVISGRNDTPSPTLTIDRVLKRNVVLSNGDRWSMTRLTPSGSHIVKHHGDVWTPSSALFPENAPQVAAARRAAEERGVKARCMTLVRKVGDAVSSEDWDGARRLCSNLSMWLERAPETPHRSAGGESK